MVGISWLPQFIILLMTVKIPGGFFLQILLKGSFKINSGLIGKADKDKEYIGQFVGQILFGDLVRSRRLFSVDSVQLHGPLLPLLR